MTTLQRDEIQNVRGQELVDPSGDTIGKVEEIYLDTQTDQPEWALVNTGLFGTKSTFVPLKEATRGGGMLRVPYEKCQVKDAPRIDPDGSGLPEGGAGTAGTTGTDAPGTVGHDTGGPSTDDAMTRSEEEVDVGTTERESGRARLRKYVVEKRAVPKERVRLDKETVTDEQHVSETARKEQIDIEEGR